VRRTLPHAVFERRRLRPARWLTRSARQSGDLDPVLARGEFWRRPRRGAVRRRQAIAREVIGLLRDETRRTAIRKNAYKLGAKWSGATWRALPAFL